MDCDVYSYVDTLTQPRRHKHTHDTLDTLASVRTNTLTHRHRHKHTHDTLDTPSSE